MEYYVTQEVLTSQLTGASENITIALSMRDLTANIFESGPMPTPILIWLASHPKLNWVKTKPRLAGNQIPFGGTKFGFV